MHHWKKLALIGLACSTGGAALAAGPLEKWEMTTRMTGGPMQMPAQKSIVCRKKTETAAPPTQSDCKLTSVSGSREKGSFTMECTKPYPTTIKGEGVETADTSEGTMTILTGGTEIHQAYSGKRVGTCDKEGVENVGGPAAMSPTGMPATGMPTMMDPRDRASARAAVEPPSPAAASAAAADAPETSDKPKNAAGKAADAAKKALQGLFPH